MERGPVNIHHIEDQIRELEQQRMSDSFNPRLSGPLPPKLPLQKATITTTASKPPVPPQPLAFNPTQAEQSLPQQKEDELPLDTKYLRSDSEYYKTVIDNLTSHLIQVTK